MKKRSFQHFKPIYVILLACISTAFIGAEQRDIKPPVAQKIPKIDTLHNEVLVDDYFWLRDRDNMKVIEYLNAENEYTEKVMHHTTELQKTLYNEMLARIKETDLSAPVKLDNYYYYHRSEKDKQYPIYCRKKDSLGADEEIILDHNDIAEGYEYCEIGELMVSPDHRLLAFMVDTLANERFTLYIKDIDNDTLFSECIPNTGYTIAWAADNRTIFYTKCDDAKRPYKLYRHTLGNDPVQDECIFHETDDALWLDVYNTKSKQYIILLSSSHTTCEIHYLDARTPYEDFSIIHPRQHEMEYYVVHCADKFYIRTNDNAKNFRICEAPVNDPQKSNWKEIIPHRDSVMIEDMEVFQNFLVIHERVNALEQLLIIDLTTSKSHYINFDEPVYTFWLHDNLDFNTDLLRFTYTSFITPKTVYEYGMNTRTRHLLKQYEVLGGFDPGLYQVERIFATAGDGTRIPISLVYRKTLQETGTNPLYLNGYGAYGASTEPYFSSNRISLLDRGFIYGIAHVRGGGELGRIWYDQGKLFNKMNTFTDYISCAEHLIEKKYTSTEHLIMAGGSAGGLLVGAVMNMRPELFKAVVTDVPFVDLINTMLDPSLPLTVLEYEEWGNPDDAAYYKYMKTYSPYDNISARHYPHILITAALNDPRVMYWEPAKWTAKLRSLKTDNNVLLLKMDMATGHMGASGRYDYLRDLAFEYAFMLDIFGIEK
jgi:oligopeptidase B